MDKPILFKGELVLKILAGTKTETRRLMKVPSSYSEGKGGDRLWVRETFTQVSACSFGHDTGVPIPHQVSADGESWAVYRADWTRGVAWRWTPSIHMPRWACRLVLPVAEARVERLHDIDEAGARAEGFEPIERSDGGLWSARLAFQDAWVAIYGKASWNANPWVWVVRWDTIVTGPEAGHE